MDRRFKPLLILLTVFSLSFTSVAAYANLLTDPLAAIQERSEVTNPQTVVSMVRVEGGNVAEAVESAIDHLGGIESIVNEGDKVLIKPNLVTTMPPPATTDPRVVEAIVNLVKPRASKVWIGEGSVYPWTINGTMENFATLGYTEVADRTGAELVNFNDVEGVDLVNITVLRGGIAFDQFTFNHIVAEADVFISVPCLKTHVVSVVSLGMKNLIGITPAPLYGWVPMKDWEPGQDFSNRRDLHSRDYVVGGPYPGTYMSSVIVDLCKARPIDLTVFSAIVGMEGMGPDYGDAVQMNLIIAGMDPVATDSVACAIIAFDPAKVPSTKRGAEEGLGINDLHKIEVKGEKIVDVFHPFKPAAGEHVSGGVAEGHEDFQFQKFSASSMMLYNSRIVLIYPAVIFWVMTITVFLVSKKRQ